MWSEVCTSPGMPATRFLFAALVAAPLAVGCSAASADAVTGDDQNQTSAATGAAQPAIQEVDDADEIYALSDPHGGYGALLKLLAAGSLVGRGDPDPTKVTWTGGKATLVIAGDLIDKGAQSLEVIDLVRSLQAQAPRSGGRVVATMGNHEAEFLLDPQNHKARSTGKDADGIDEELAARGIDPAKVANGTDAEGRGKWLIGLPQGVRVKKWFFAHGGNTQRLSLKDLSKKLESSIAHHGFGDQDLTGKDSILEAQSWYGNPSDDNAGQKEVEALGVSHIVFGHDPGAFGEHGRIRRTKNGLLVKLDVAMGLQGAHGPNAGQMLHISTRGKDVAEVLDDSGKVSPLD